MTDSVEAPFGPQRVGGRYFSGYYQEEYVVQAIGDGTITVRWADGDVMEHARLWDATRGDRVISEPLEWVTEAWRYETSR
jgi:hypothetical protein